MAGIETKKWDVVPALCITDKRKEVVDFSESYITIGATLTTLADNPKGLTTVEAFNRPEVVFAVPSGSWSESVAKEVAPKATMKGFGQSTSADLIQEVVAGRADAVVLDTPIQTTVALAAFGDKIRIVPGHNKPLDVRACKVGYAYLKGGHEDGASISTASSRRSASRASSMPWQAVHDRRADQGDELDDAETTPWTISSSAGSSSTCPTCSNGVVA